jgi:hypothetical protein
MFEAVAICESQDKNGHHGTNKKNQYPNKWTHLTPILSEALPALDLANTWNSSSEYIKVEPADLRVSVTRSSPWRPMPPWRRINPRFRSPALTVQATKASKCCVAIANITKIDEPARKT